MVVASRQILSRLRRVASPPRDPEEIIARSLCHEDPDAITARGPLWTGYRKEARRVIAALGPLLGAPGREPALTALRELVETIDGAGYRDKLGRRLELSGAFHEAREIVNALAPLPDDSTFSASGAVRRRA